MTQTFKETPIPLDDHSVLSLLHGEKQQHRLVYPQKFRRVFLYMKENKTLLPYIRTFQGDLEKWMPYGDKGDFLWVQEPWSFAIHEGNQNRMMLRYKSDLNALDCTTYPSLQISYALQSKCSESPGYFHSQPVHLMPRVASRLLLQITHVRIERLHDISDDDLLKEGFEHPDPYIRRQEFRKWWDGIHTYKSDWIANPFVWVIDFQKRASAAAAIFDPS